MDAEPGGNQESNGDLVVISTKFWPENFRVHKFRGGRRLPSETRGQKGPAFVQSVYTAMVMGTSDALKRGTVV